MADPITNQPSTEEFEPANPPQDLETQLAIKYAPVLYFDRGERSYPTSVSDFWKGASFYKVKPIGCCDAACTAIPGCKNSCFRTMLWRTDTSRYAPATQSADEIKELFAIRESWPNEEKSSRCGRCCKGCLRSTFCIPCFCCVDSWKRRKPDPEAKKMLYFQVTETQSFYVIQYIMFFEYNQLDCPSGWFNNHEASFRHMSVVVRKDSHFPYSVLYGSRDGRSDIWVPAHEVQWKKETHPAVWVAKGSHGLYPRGDVWGGICCGLGLQPRSLCCANDYTRRICTAERMTFGGMYGYSIEDVNSEDNKAWREFEGTLGWFKPALGDKSIIHKKFFQEGEESRMSSTGWTRFFSCVVGCCYPTDNAPLRGSELSHFKRMPEGEEIPDKKYLGTAL